MQLPLDNPPAGTKVKQASGRVELTRTVVSNPIQEQATSIPIAALAIFVMVTGVRVMASSLPAVDILLSPLTFGLLLITAIPAFLIVRIVRRQGVKDVLILEPGRLVRKNLRYGIEENAELEKSRVTRLIRSRPRNPDGTLYGGGSVEAEFRTEGGQTKELSLMYSVTRSDAEVDWYVRVLEAWSGVRSRVEEFTIDQDEEDDDEELDDFDDGMDDQDQQSSR